MILYLDAGALVKRYVLETETAAVETLLATADLVGTSLISRAEVSPQFVRRRAWELWIAAKLLPPLSFFAFTGPTSSGSGSTG